MTPVERAIAELRQATARKPWARTREIAALMGVQPGYVSGLLCIAERAGETEARCCGGGQVEWRVL